MCYFKNKRSYHHDECIRFIKNKFEKGIITKKQLGEILEDLKQKKIYIKTMDEILKELHNKVSEKTNQ